MRIRKRVIVIVSAAVIVLLWALSFLSPEWTIRRHILEHLQPINSLKAEISTLGKVDPEYGYLYNVDGLMDTTTGDELGAV
ncbi:hypothetical protein [Paenibacillus harenae]|uniref:Uncharacterized protein n=2 Tax=Paenibacillus harenae TaxID=306543 RepID=A0ABT9U2V5_PAEHA|nr:hypothetical protein [Paenibacillus harenae]MDQ0113960.1 hypothetical protein [Paenibacillus harenae]